MTDPCPELRREFSPLVTASGELASVLYFDRAGIPIGSRWFDSRRVHSVEVPIRDVVADALAFEAVRVELAHNHPGGDVAPSEDDLVFTRRLYSTLDAIGVRLHDHFVVSGTAWMSFRAAGLL